MSQPRPISSLRGHHGGTIYVVGSGSSLDALDPEAYRSEVTVAMNRVPLLWPLEPTYALTKYQADAAELLDAGLRGVVVSRGDRGHNPEGEPLAGAAWYFDHLPMPDGWDFDLDALWPEGPNRLVNAQTVQMTAIHFAAHLGAERIVMLGCSGYSHVAGYYPEEAQRRIQASWLAGIRPLVAQVAERVREVYGCSVEGLPE